MSVGFVRSFLLVVVWLRSSSFHDHHQLTRHNDKSGTSDESTADLWKTISGGTGRARKVRGLWSCTGARRTVSGQNSLTFVEFRQIRIVINWGVGLYIRMSTNTYRNDIAICHGLHYPWRRSLSSLPPSLYTVNSLKVWLVFGKFYMGRILFIGYGVALTQTEIQLVFQSYTSRV